MTTLVDSLRVRLGEIEKELEEDSKRLQKLTAAMTQKKQAMQAIEDLIRLEGGEPVQRSSVTPFPNLTRASANVADLAYEVLMERGSALHYHDLYREVAGRGGGLGGKTPANTFLARLSRDDRFYRPRRGTYALREWAPKARSVGVRRKKGA